MTDERPALTSHEAAMPSSAGLATAKRSRCIIHIGMHKTGSTSIQQALARFENDRFFYGRLGQSPNHSVPIFSIFASRPERHHLHRAADRQPADVRRYIDTVWQDLDRCVTAARSRTLVISGEDIGTLPERDLVKMQKYFDARFDELTIVGYVRPPAGFISSGFQQRVKSGSINVFDPFRIYRNYQRSFIKFDRVFDRERVHLWKFDPKAFPEGDVVMDFCQRLGIPFEPNKIVRMNESLSGKAIAALYAYNKFGEFAGANILSGAGGAALLKMLKGDKFRLSPDTVRPVLERNRADIEWMEQRLGQSLYEELGSHRDGDVRDENDLLRPDPEVAAILLSRLGKSVPHGVEGKTPREIAILIEALRVQRRYLDAAWWADRLTGEPLQRIATRPNSATSRSEDIIDSLHWAKPSALEGIPADIAKKLVRDAFSHINRRLGATAQGHVRYVGLGSFNVSVPKNQTSENMKRIRYRSQAKRPTKS